MIERIVEFALRQRAVIVVAAAIIAILGLFAFQRLPIEAYPDVADTWVQVITQWPGHAAEEVERQITIPAERVLNGVPKQVAVRSTSIAGLSVITLIFADGTDSYFARQQVNERLGQASLPDGVAPTLGPLASPVGEILRYRLVNCQTTHTPECTDEDARIDPKSLNDLKDLEEWVLERELAAVPGVADVVSFGGTVKQFQVLVDPTQLAARNLTMDDVEKALTAANGNAGGGVVHFGRAALNVRGIGLLTPDQIGDVSIAVRDGTPVRVRHVATIKVGHQPRLGRVSVDADSDVVSATVLMRKGAQTDTVLAALHERIDDINRRILPRGVKLSPHNDRTELMDLTTHTVMKNLVEGIGLVTVVLFLFLGNTRAALIVAVTIPLSLLIAFILMDSAKIPANLLSIGAVDFGMIVDGSIVMVENVFRQLAEKQERGESYDLPLLVRAASREVARPVVFAIAIIVTAYLPIFTLERVEGKLFSPMAWTVAFALGGALLLAITLVPVLTSLLFTKRLKEFHNPLLELVRRSYLPALGRALARPRLVLVVAVVLVLGDVIMARSIGSEFLPHLDEGSIWMRASMPSNISLEEAEALVDGVHTPSRDMAGMREILGRYPEVRTLSAQIGRPDDGTDPTGFYNAEFLLVLNDKKTWRPEFHADKDALIAAMNADLSIIPGVTFGFSQPISDNIEEAITGVKGQLAIKIVGDDLNALDDIADQMARAIKTVPGVVDLGVLRELGQSNVHVSIVRERAERYGMTVADVEDAVEKGIGGHAVGEIIEGERRHDLVVRYRADMRDSVDAIRQLLIPVSGGNLVPLSQVADVTILGGASRIYRESNRRYIAIKFGVRERDLGGTVAEAQKRVAKAVHLPPGYTATWGGEFESARRAGRRLAIVIPLTVAAVFILLFAMFRRPREALIILVNVLLTSPCGGMAALLATGTNFSVSSGVGFLALFGVSVQTGVILVSYIKEQRAEGMPLDEAIERAADLRLRPIMMTALVATLGLIPAAISTGIGSDSQKPLAIVVVGGLFSSLTLSLFVLPMLYKVFGPREPLRSRY
ncbi:CusA/CzcA family heavy metal efflux RND transporter [Pendulispora brunnea]|uniref:CusA/CzcA family heavy metal efflux RND transporter n=1 Tax=Pendulispora brunnea TaxID=2905690 RepID=A0ABZ2KLQ6_9BACT